MAYIYHIYHMYFSKRDSRLEDVEPGVQLRKSASGMYRTDFYYYVKLNHYGIYVLYILLILFIVSTGTNDSKGVEPGVWLKNAASGVCITCFYCYVV